MVTVTTHPKSRTQPKNRSTPHNKINQHTQKKTHEHNHILSSLEPRCLAVDFHLVDALVLLAVAPELLHERGVRQLQIRTEAIKQRLYNELEEPVHASNT